MFYRASVNSAGSGLGMYIVKEVVHKVGGTIVVHSEFGGRNLWLIYRISFSNSKHNRVKESQQCN